MTAHYNTSITLPGCEVHNGHLDVPKWYADSDANETTPRYGYWGIFQQVKCSNLDPSDPKFNRYTISVAYSKGIAQNNAIMLNSSNVVCTPSYHIQRGNISIFTNGSLNGDIKFSKAQSHVEGITADDILLAARYSLQQTTIPSSFDSDYLEVDGFLNAMIRATPEFKVEMLMNNSWLEVKSKEVYQQHAA